MSEKKANHILKKLDDAHALWFAASKSFLLLEKPAFEVFRRYTAREKKREIIKACTLKFGHIESNISQFVTEIIDQIQYFNNRANRITLSKKTKVKNTAAGVVFLPPVHYQIGDKAITMLYGNEYLKFANHPLIAHLETETPAKSEHIIECFESEQLLVVRYNGKLVEAFGPDKIEYYTGSIKQLMYSILYNKKYNGWMTMLHASGVAANNRAVLFSAAAGSGKTTISAILKAHGFIYLSDDFIAACNHGKAYPFPAAISVKSGSVPALLKYYPELANEEVKISFIGKQVRYIPVFNVTGEPGNGIPVKAFVFVQYAAKGDFVFEKVEKKKALQLLLQETWVNPVPESVSGFFNWIENTEFYRLQYSKNEQALEAVQKIMNE